MKRIQVEVIKGDITDLGFHVGAIVNAANKHLVGGAGVDGAIHAVGGGEIALECKEIIDDIGVLKEGGVVITTAGELEADYVFHAVGPMVRNGVTEEKANSLKDCYKYAIMLAEDNGCKSIAFSNISTGVYGYPKLDALNQALKGVKEGIELGVENLEKIYFVCFDQENYDLYIEDLDKIVIDIAISDVNRYAPELSKKFNNSIGLYADGLFDKGQFIKVNSKLYTLNDATHFVIMPNEADLSEVNGILESEGIQTAICLNSDVAEILLGDLFNDICFEELHIFELLDEIARDAFITYLLLLAPRLIGENIEESQVPFLLTIALQGIEEIVIGENYSDTELEEEMIMNIWGINKNGELSNCTCDEDCTCDEGCTCGEDCTCEEDSYYEEDDYEYEPTFEGEDENPDINLFSDEDEDEEYDMNEPLGFSSGLGLGIHSGFAEETPSERIGLMVAEMVEKLEFGSISKLKVKVKKDDESDGFKVKFTVLVE